jgi:predicted dehydrogenase
VGEYVLDANDSAVLSIEFKNGALGTIHTTRWAGGHINRLYLKISGTKGSIEIDSERTTTGYRLSVGKDLDKGLWKEVDAPPVPTIYQRFIKAILTGNQDQPDFARGAEIQKILDAGFKSDAEQRPVKV